MKIDYSNLDAAILKRISQGKSTFTQILAEEVLQEANFLRDQQSQEYRRYRDKPNWRFVDSRLQALRRRKLIQFNSKEGWCRVATSGESNT